MERLKKFVFKPTDLLISYDVESLFTNVPLQETIEVVADYVYKSDNKPPFNKQTFVELLKIATSGVFLYKERLYKQVDGVTMGSPLGPTLANFCLAHHENKLLEKTNSKPNLYVRYVDDIFCVFHERHAAMKFFEELNQMHHCLKFTFELGPTVLPFLDTSIDITDDIGGKFRSYVYRKASNTGLLLNFHAVCPFNWKVGLVYCMINRAYMICNEWSLFSKEIDYLKNMFSSNGYPKSMIDKYVNQFLNSKYNPQMKAPKEDTVTIHMSLPYIGKPSLLLARKLKTLFKNHFHVTLQCTFDSTKIRNFFSLKCPTPKALKSNVVYQYTCSCDVNNSYIGKTKRHLITRVTEHRADKSAIGQHLSRCSSCRNSFGIDQFKIISNGRTDVECKIKEALNIKNSNPTLNQNLFQHGSSFLINVFK